MRRVNTLTVLVGASLMVSAIARASEPGLPWQVSGSQEVSAVSAARYAGRDWSALIGSGEAAAVEAGVVRANDVVPGRAQTYPKPDWTVAIGRGSAATRPIS